MVNNKQKALIHVAKAQVGMTEAEYRDLLAGFGAESCVDLDHRGFDQVMQRFKDLGFVKKAVGRKQKRVGSKRKPIYVTDDKAKLMGKIRAIIADLKLSWSYADGVAKKMFKIEFVEWCTPEQLKKIVAALVYHQKRKKEKTANGHG